MKKRIEKPRIQTFDCLNCGNTFSMRLDDYTCPDCNLPMRPRPFDDSKPGWLQQEMCPGCDISCQKCEIFDEKQWCRSWYLTNHGIVV